MFSVTNTGTTFESRVSAHLPVLNVGQHFQFFSPIEGGEQEYEAVAVHMHELVNPLQESRFLKSARDVLRFYQQESSACIYRNHLLTTCTVSPLPDTIVFSISLCYWHCTFDNKANLNLLLALTASLHVRCFHTVVVTTHTKKVFCL